MSENESAVAESAAPSSSEDEITYQAVEKDGVEVIEVAGVARASGDGLLGDELRIGTDVSFERAGFAAQ